MSDLSIGEEASFEEIAYDKVATKQTSDDSLLKTLNSIAYQSWKKDRQTVKFKEKLITMREELLTQAEVQAIVNLSGDKDLVTKLLVQSSTVKKIIQEIE